MKKIYAVILLSVFVNTYLVFDKYGMRAITYAKNRGFLQKTYDVNIDERTFVLFTFGQSSTGNCAQDAYQPTEEVYNYYNKKIYKAVEPLKGTNGNGGISVWSRVADKLIKSGKCDKVIIVPIGRGGTNIDFWANGKGNDLLRQTLNDLTNKGIVPTHFLWNQGPANNGKDVIEYRKNLQVVLKTVREYHKETPFYCTIATYNKLSNLYDTHGVDIDLQNTQKSFVNENNNIFLGPETDTMIEAIYRYDGQHFSSYGNKLYAQMWVDALK